MNEVPEMRSVRRLYGGSWGLLMAMVFAPGSASDLVIFSLQIEESSF